MMCRVVNILLFSLFSLLFFSSCEHRPLTDPVDTHYVRVYFDEQIKNVTCGFYNSELERPEYDSPGIVRVVLASPETGEIVSERYLSKKSRDGNGNYVDGYIAAPAGTYNVMVYQMGSSVTHFRNEDNFYQMEAFTTQISDRLMQYLPTISSEVDKSCIVNQPEHIFHSVYENVKLVTNTEPDTLRSASGDYFTAGSMVKSYYMQVRVKGFESIKSAVCVINGMAGSVKMCGYNLLDASNPVYVFSGMNYTARERVQKSNTTTALLYATFNTFGRVPDYDDGYIISFEFILGDGSTQTEKIDITNLFDTPYVKENQWIILDQEIEINYTGGGGLDPGVEGWKDIEADIIM